MKKRNIYTIFVVCLLVGGAFVIGTVSAQRKKQAPKPDGGYTREGKYLKANGTPVDYTWCYPGTWTPVPLQGWQCLRHGAPRRTGCSRLMIIPVPS